MSAELLQKLKVKNAPAPKIKVMVRVPVHLKATIKDKRQDAQIDRMDFIMKANPQKKRGVPPINQKIIRGDTRAKPNQSLALPDELIMEIIGRLKKKLVLEQIASAETKRLRRRTISPLGIAEDAPLPDIQIGDTVIQSRVGEKPKEFRVRASSYYMNNRKIFMNFMTQIFEPYRKEIEANAGKASCDRGDSITFSLMAHQKIVRDYINLYTPYRGLLLYHGLGSGKTCTSIAIAEGIKTSRPIIVLTPASLRMNYIEELKKCGDSLYKKNQYWEFIHTEGKPELMNILSNILSISVDFIKKQKGAWLVNVTKKANFGALDSVAKTSVDMQINEMISHKYRFINYNGLRNSHLRDLSKNYSINPFDSAVIIIDEAHNFVSRIVNKLKKPDSLSMRLYEYLSTAENAKIVFLTGTPIINYPNEIGILFNILRGKIKTWSFRLNITDRRKINTDFFKDLFNSGDGNSIMDFIEYKASSTTLTVTRNPYGFVNKNDDKIYKGVYINENGEISDKDFVAITTTLLNEKNIEIAPNGISVAYHNALPDTLEGFNSYFINDDNSVKNMNLLKGRILGLTSYFRSAQESSCRHIQKPRTFM